MKITKEMLKAKSPCTDGYEWYLRKFPDGGEYQEILDALCEDDRFNDACWLLNAFGKTDDVLEVETLERKSFVFAGSIRVKGWIKIDFSLQAGEGIEAGWGIEAGEGIKAGEGIEAGEGIKAGEGIEAGSGIKAGWGIEAGEDYGIFAALRQRLPKWSVYGRVIAKTKPINLMTGHWVEPVESENKEVA